MRLLVIMGLCFLVAGCSDGNYNRGYVISKSHVDPEAAVDGEEKPITD